MSIMTEMRDMALGLASTFPIPKIAGIVFPPFYAGGQPHDCEFMARGNSGDIIPNYSFKVGFGPGFRGRRTRSVMNSVFSSKASLPQGRPILVFPRKTSSSSLSFDKNSRQLSIGSSSYFFLSKNARLITGQSKMQLKKVLTDTETNLDTFTKSIK